MKRKIRNTRLNKKATTTAIPIDMNIPYAPSATRNIGRINLAMLDKSLSVKGVISDDLMPRIEFGVEKANDARSNLGLEKLSITPEIYRAAAIALVNTMNKSSFDQNYCANFTKHIQSVQRYVELSNLDFEGKKMVNGLVGKLIDNFPKVAEKHEQLLYSKVENAIKQKNLAMFKASKQEYVSFVNNYHNLFNMTEEAADEEISKLNFGENK